MEVARSGPGRFVVTNVRGGTIELGTGDDAAFTPVELLLAAIGGCTGIDVDVLTSRRAEPSVFTVTMSGDSIHDDEGSRLGNIDGAFDVRFPAGAEGDAARAVLPQAVQRSHDRLCTVSRTVERGTAVALHLGADPDDASEPRHASA